MRPTTDEHFLNMAILNSQRGTCSRRKVGCVVVNHLNHIIATGYNGVAASRPHCTDKPCAGAKCESGEGLDLCEAIHAEANALLQCRDVDSITTIYCTDSPCVHCVKLLLNTSCTKIIFLREYPHGISKKLWEDAGRQWIKLETVSRVRPRLLEFINI